jgi:NAD kinase
MKIQLYGKNSHNLSEQLKSLGFEIVTDHPDVILSYGGDGTLLSSERKFPGIPKLPIRDSNVCIKCSDHTTEHILELLKKNHLKLEELTKLEFRFHNESFTALNEIVIRNSIPIHAIRFKVFKNGDKVLPEIVLGDGIVASTPWGSTGYFQSITRHSFKTDFKLAFNNTTIPLSPVVFKNSDVISLEIVRGPATLSVDNNPMLLTLKEKDIIEIKPSKHNAHIYSPKTLRCDKCKLDRGKRLRD